MLVGAGFTAYCAYVFKTHIVCMCFVCVGAPWCLPTLGRVYVCIPYFIAGQPYLVFRPVLYQLSSSIFGLLTGILSQIFMHRSFVIDPGEFIMRMFAMVCLSIGQPNTSPCPLQIFTLHWQKIYLIPKSPLIFVWFSGGRQCWGSGLNVSTDTFSERSIDLEYSAFGSTQSWRQGSRWIFNFPVISS